MTFKLMVVTRVPGHQKKIQENKLREFRENKRHRRARDNTVVTDLKKKKQYKSSPF